MKVLMINVVCGIRSTGRICTDLATALEKQGHQVKIAYGRENVPEQFQKYAVRIGNDLDVKLHGVKARLLDGAGFGSKAVTEKFIEWVKKYDPDVIHLHNLHGYYINVEILFKYLKTCGKRIIWTLHDCWAFTGHTAYCDSVSCERWRKGCYKCPLQKEYPKSLIDRSQYNWEKKKRLFIEIPDLTIVTPSYWLEGMVKNSFLKDYKTKTIHNGIDTSQFYPIKNDFKDFWNIRDKKILLGVATCWDKNKGLNDFIELNNYLSREYKIVLVGLSDEQLKILPKSIIGIKRTSSVKELVQIYSSADIFLNLSYCENYPTVNIEALACGIPIVSYNVGGGPEIVKKYGGYVVERGNLKEVIKRISVLSKNPISIQFDRNENSIQEVNKKYNEIMRGGGILL